MPLLESLQDNPALLLAAVTALGLCVGSFLNVLAYRLPLMLEQRFREACQESFQCAPQEAAEVSVSLWRPASSCPSCGAPIKPWHNIPLISWVALKGRCATCSAGISIQYPLVEAATALMSLVCAWHFGYSPQLGGALVLTWALIALTVTDLRTLYLPDDLTLPLIWLGLLASLQNVFCDSPDAIIGAVAGYLILWGVFWAFKLLTGKEGMGYGDFKLLSALGAWLGWQALPQVILLSALVGAAVGVTLMLLRKAEWSSRLPFGPYLAGAGWIAMIWGDRMLETYLRTAGLG